MAAADSGGGRMAMGAPDGTVQVRISRIELECGRALDDATLTASTYGKLNPQGTNGVLVGHSLTSDSQVHTWWGEMLSAKEGGEAAPAAGHGRCLDTSKYFIVCFNFLGSPYGSSSPMDEGGFAAFPAPVTMRDQARAMLRGCELLGVRSLALAIGGSMGAMLALEVALEGGPEMVRAVCAVAGCARHPDWATGQHEVQRQAVFADPLWRGGTYPASHPPHQGLQIARMAAMLTYRSTESYADKFERRGSHRACPPALEDRAGTWCAASRKPGATGPGSRYDTTGGVAAPPPPRAGAQGPAAPVPVAPAGASGRVGLPYWSVESYLHHHGTKFLSRFDPGCYVALTYTVDSQDVGRGRGGVEAALASLASPLLVVGVDSDGLYPLSMQTAVAKGARHGSLSVLSSPVGHDGFLVEIERLNEVVGDWMADACEGAGRARL